VWSCALPHFKCDVYTQILGCNQRENVRATRLKRPQQVTDEMYHKEGSWRAHQLIGALSISLYNLSQTRRLAQVKEYVHNTESWMQYNPYLSPNCRNLIKDCTNTGYTTGWTIQGSDPVRGKRWYVSLLQNVQTGSQNHPACY